MSYLSSFRVARSTNNISSAVALGSKSKALYTPAKFVQNVIKDSRLSSALSKTTWKGSLRPLVHFRAFATEPDKCKVQTNHLSLDESIHGYRLIQNALDNVGRSKGWEIADENDDISPLLCKLQGISSYCDTIHKPFYSSDPTWSITVNKETTAGSIWDPKIEALVAAAVPAPFGNKDQTVYDEDVRKGLQIAAKDLQIEALQEIIPSKIQYLAPRNHYLFPQLYKMHIYKEGGHFKEHVDTQHGENHLATLVIALPSPFEGGEESCLHISWIEDSRVGAVG